MMNELYLPQNTQLLLSVIMLIGLGLCLSWVVRLRRFNQHQKQSTETMVQQAMQAEMQSMSSSLMLLGERLLDMEDKINQVNQRQEMIEGNSRTHSYGDAMEMARQGASSRDIQEKCRISRTEADLVVLLHGNRRHF